MTHKKSLQTPRENTKLDLLCFAPHPDDIEVFCGGLIALSVQQKQKVGIIDMTKGELSSNGDLITRAKETQRASKILGINIRENLGFQDGSIGLDTKKLSREKQLATIVGMIRKYRPSVVLIPYWEERHPDHVRASNLITESLFFCGAKKFKSIPDLPAISSNSTNTENSVPKAIYYSFRATFKPSFITNITSVYDIKLNSIGAYESQIGTSQKSYLESLIISNSTKTSITKDKKHKINAQNEFATLLASKLSITSIISKDQFYGSMIGVEYGEGYLSKTPISIDNCLELLKNGGTSYLY